MPGIASRNLYTDFLLLLLLPSVPVFAQRSASSTEIKYLSGTDKDHRVDWEFMIDKGRRKNTWTTIPVPSNWELEGFGAYNYGHDWRDSLPVSDAVGHYRYTFRAPKEWKEKSVEIVFEGVMTDTEVKINGKLAGAVHQGGFYRFKYDISNLLKYGRNNMLEVNVKNTSANASVNKAERDADFWVFGGIYRPVYLELKPKEHIERVAIDARANGDFAADLFLKNISSATTAEARILSTKDEPVGEAFAVSVEKKADRLRLTHHINEPKLWSPEYPNLYKVEFSIKDDKGTIHTVKETFGFRTVELREKDGFYVNGKKIKFKGVNRHSSWPTSGRTMSKELSIMDVNLMKDMNMNAVRMSHYPPDQHFLEVCDSLGLFVIDELTGWQDAYDTVVGTKLVKELIVRDVNHPSIVLWANGNEGGNNYALLEEYPKYDIQKRVVIHPWNTLGETNTFHYPDLNYVMDVLRNRNKIYFPTEMLHGLYDGGHGAGLEDFWAVMQRSQLSAGGFLWVLADEGIVRQDQNDEMDTRGTLAPDGIVGPYREKEASFFTIKEIWSPVFIDKEHISSGFDGRLKVENRFAYTDLKDCRFEWELVQFPLPGAESGEPIIITKKEIKLPSVLPGLSGYAELGLPENWINADALNFTATDPHGRHIHTWTWPVKTSAAFSKQIITETTVQSASAVEDDRSVTVSANGVEIRFSKKSGLMESVKNARNTVSFSNGPKLISGKSGFKSLRHFKEGNNHVVELAFDGAISEMRFTMLGSGWLKLDYTYNLYGDFDYAGITFSYPEEKVKSVRWLGNGPFRVWKNRMKGARFAVHQKTFNNAVTGKRWGYPEFKGYHDRMFWAVIETEESPITIVSETDHVFMRLFTPEPTGHAKVDPLFPEGDISFMDGITPIGTKFKNAPQLGPQGSKNQYTYRRDRERLLGATLYFNFGADCSRK